MALSAENKQFLERLTAEIPEADHVIVSAWSMLDRLQETTHVGTRADLSLGEEEKFAVHLSQAALSISILRKEAAGPIIAQTDSDLSDYPRLSLVLGMRTDFHPGESPYSPYYSRVIAADALGRDITPEVPFTFEDFEPIFYHTAAQHGLYHYLQVAYAEAA